MRRYIYPGVAALLVLAVLTSSAMAHADDELRAQFRLGMELLAKGEFDGACAAFEKAEAKGPSVGSSYQLGRCNEGRGKYGTAHESYARAAMLADRAGDAERATVARQRAAEVAPKAPKLLITVANQVDGMTVRIDGKAVDDWKTAQPIAEGSHRVEVSAQGRSSVTLTAEASAPSQVVRVTVPELPPLASTPPVQAQREERRRNPALFWTGVGLTIGGGAAAIAGGAILGQSEATGSEPHPGGITLLVGAAALLGVGIPFMIVYGRKEPAEPAAALIVGPTSASLRLSF